MVDVARTAEPNQEGTTRRNVLKGGGAAVGAFIAFEAIGGVSLAAGTSPKSTPLGDVLAVALHRSAPWTCRPRRSSCTCAADEWPQRKACQASRGNDDRLVELEAPEDRKTDQTDRGGGQVEDGALPQDDHRPGDRTGCGGRRALDKSPE